MANQIADNLTIANSVYYAAVHPTQVHTFYNRFVFNAYGRNTLSGWVEYNANRVQKPAMIFDHVEYDRLQLPIQSATTVSGAAGAAVTVTIGPSSAYLNSGTYDPIQPGYKLFDGANTYTVDSVNTAVAYAHTMVVYPDLSTVAISFTAGQLLYVNKQVAVREGSTKSKNSLWGDGIVFQNSLQEFRRDEEFTGQAMNQFSASVTFWDYPNAETGESEAFWSQAELDRVMVEMKNNKEVYCITGVATTNSYVTSTYGLGTTGVIPAIKAWGNTKNYSKAAGWQISDFEDLSLVMEKNNSVDEYLMWDGIELSNDTDLAIKDFFPNGSLNFGAVGGSQEESVKLGFTTFGAFGRTFHRHRMEIFNRPDFLGAAFSTKGSDYVGNAIVLPAGKAQGVGGGNSQYINMATLAGNGYEYGYDHWVVDGMGYFKDSVYRPTDKRSVLFCFADAYGVEVNAAKQLFYVQRTN